MSLPFVLDNSTIYFRKLCICTGSSPRNLLSSCSSSSSNISTLVGDASNFIHVLRDSKSVDYLLNILYSMDKHVYNHQLKSITIIGNGGIALEIIYLVSISIVYNLLHIHNISIIPYMHTIDVAIKIKNECFCWLIMEYSMDDQR